MYSLLHDSLILSPFAFAVWSIHAAYLTWDIDKISHCSKAFHTVFIMLCSCRAPEVSRIDVFRKVVHKLGGSDLMNFIVELLEISPTAS